MTDYLWRYALGCVLLAFLCGTSFATAVVSALCGHWGNVGPFTLLATLFAVMVVIGLRFIRRCLDDA